MPNTSIEDARNWMNANKSRTPHNLKKIESELQRPLVEIPLEGDDLEVSVKRLRLAERTIYAEIEAWLRLLGELEASRARASDGNLSDLDRKITVVHHKIEVLRREQRQAVTILLDAEAAVVRLGKARGSLISLDDAKDMLTKEWLPIIVEIRRLPEMAENDRERQRLSAKSEAMLGMMRQTFIDFVQKKLDDAYGPEPTACSLPT